MNLKKHLLMSKAQSSIEYLILFAIITLLTLISINDLFPRLRTAGQDFFNSAINALD